MSKFRVHPEVKSCSSPEEGVLRLSLLFALSGNGAALGARSRGCSHPSCIPATYFATTHEATSTKHQARICRAHALPEIYPLRSAVWLERTEDRMRNIRPTGEQSVDEAPRVFWRYFQVSVAWSYASFKVNWLVGRPSSPSNVPPRQLEARQGASEVTSNTFRACSILWSVDTKRGRGAKRGRSLVIRSSKQAHLRAATAQMANSHCPHDISRLPDSPESIAISCTSRPCPNGSLEW